MQLNEICELIIDCEHKTAPTQESGHPSIRTPNIGRGYFILENVNRVSQETYEQWTKRAIPQAGDLIMAREAPVGNVALIPEGLKPCLGQRTLLIRPDKNKVNPAYLTYLLIGPDVQGLIHSKTNGATVAHLNMKDVRQLELPKLPDRKNQDEIAEILSAYDSLIENNNRRIAILEKMAQSLYREWFVNFRFPGHENCKFVDSVLGKVPEGWGGKKLKDVCHLTMGQSPKSEFYNEVGEGMPFHQGVTNFGTRYPSDKLYCTADGRVANEGDILFSVRAPVGRMNIANKKIVIGRGISAIRHVDGYQAFLWEQLKAQFTKLDMIGNGAIFAAVTKDDMQGIDLLCPDKAIVEMAIEFLDPLYLEISNISKAIITLKEQRDMLLPRLVSGQLELSQ